MSQYEERYATFESLREAEMEAEWNAQWDYTAELRAEHEDTALEAEEEWHALDAVGLGGRYGTPTYLGKVMWYECCDPRFDTEIPF